MKNKLVIFILCALGLNIVVGYAGLLDLGYVAFYAVGAYMYALLASPHLTENFEWIAAAFPNGLHTPVFLAIPLAAGKHHIQLEYRPPNYALGLWVSGISAIGCVGGLAAWAWRSTRAASKISPAQAAEGSGTTAVSRNACVAPPNVP